MRLWHLLLWLDQGLNVLFGSGWPDEMLSAYAYRKGDWRYRTINALFFWQEDHCRDAYWTERNRKQLPSEYYCDKSQATSN